MECQLSFAQGATIFTSLFLVDDARGLVSFAAHDFRGFDVARATILAAGELRTIVATTPAALRRAANAGGLEPAQTVGARFACCFDRGVSRES